ncbi:MAG: DUF4230 domain-containing protein [Oscillospiraceae bacterium]|nr:DUF4230 domain-containing protein [Oscillospiraceae bacterium]
MGENEAKKNIKIPRILIIAGISAVIIGIACVAIFLKFRNSESPKPNPSITTIARLEKIVETSELSTFTAVYNGVAKVPSPENPDQVDYYVSYEAMVYAGLDFSKIDFELDDEQGTLQVKLPPIHIGKANVDITTMDFIFINEKRNAFAVSEEAYKACEADVKEESEATEEIFKLARQNAENVIKALINPFVEQPDVGLELKIVWEGKL